MNGIFRGGAERGSWVGQLFYPFADVAVLRSENTSDKKSIVHTLSLKDGFFVGYIKIRKRARSFGGITEKTRTVNNTLHALIDCVRMVYIIILSRNVPHRIYVSNLQLRVSDRCSSAHC